MMKIESTTDFSELVHSPLERARESLIVWRLRYGDVNDSDDHTETSLIYFGLIPTNAVCAKGLLWAEPMPAARNAPRSLLREALTVWFRFAAEHPWTFTAFCDRDSEVNNRFAKHLGFQPFVEDDQYAFYEGKF